MSIKNVSGPKFHQNLAAALRGGAVSFRHPLVAYNAFTFAKTLMKSPTPLKTALEAMDKGDRVARFGLGVQTVTKSDPKDIWK
jgi:hypothetical protein